MKDLHTGPPGMLSKGHTCSLPIVPLLLLALCLRSTACGAGDSDPLTESRDILRAIQRTGIPPDPARFAELRQQARSILLYPNMSEISSPAWISFVENIAIGSFQLTEGDFESSKAELHRWLLQIDRSPIGNRSRRATLCARLWTAYQQWWVDAAPEKIRENLNAARPAFIQIAATSEREGIQFAESVMRSTIFTRAAKQEVAVDPSDAARELTASLETSTLPPTVCHAFIANQARITYAAGSPESALRKLNSIWSEAVTQNACPKTLCSAFFIQWYGLADRAAAQSLLRTADGLIEQGRIDPGQSDLQAMWEAYYSGLPLTSDQLRLHAHENTNHP